LKTVECLLSLFFYYYINFISTFNQLWCGVVYCNILPFIVNALVLQESFFLIFVRGMYREWRGCKPM